MKDSTFTAPGRTLGADARHGGRMFGQNHHEHLLPDYLQRPT